MGQFGTSGSPADIGKPRPFRKLGALTTCTFLGDSLLAQALRLSSWTPEVQLHHRNHRLDDKGFILTGRDLNGATGAPGWRLARSPQMLETSRPGVFAVGDVRSGNVKRVASAVGEGAIAVHLVHRALAET